MKKPSIAVIGAGVVGTAIAALLRRKGYRIKGVASRTLESARKAVQYIGEGDASTDLAEVASRADLVFITTPDRVISPVCEQIAAQKGFSGGAVVIHCCGAHSAKILSSAHACGAKILSMHPLQTLADRDQAVANLPGSFFALDGDEEALERGREVIDALGGTVMVIPSDGKMLYHAAAVVACNYVVALVFQALRMFEAVDIPKDKGLAALLPLIKGTVKNLERVGIPGALTGPIERGDLKTIQGHLEAFETFMPQGRKIYCEMGKVAVDLAEAKGSINTETKAGLLELFK